MTDQYTPATYSLDDLYNKQTSEEQVKEANAFKTLPTGVYMLQPTKAEPRLAGDKSPWPGRRMVHITADAINSEGRKGKVFFDASFEVVKNDKGKQDGPSNKWGQFVKALGLETESIGKIIESLTLYPVQGRITEAFKKLEGGYVYPNTPEEIKAATDAGLEPVNFVQSIYKAV